MAEAGWENLTLAFDYFAESQDVPNAIAVALYFVAPGHRYPGMAKLVARALEMVPSDSREAGHLLSRYGWVLGVEEGDYEGAKEALDRALVLAHREADVDSERRILSDLGVVAGNHLHWHECVENTLGNADLVTKTEYDTRFGNHYWASLAFLAMGNLGEAREQSNATLDVAESSREPRKRSAALAFRASLSYAEGNWQAIRDIRVQESGTRQSSGLIFSIKMLGEYQTGNFDQADAHLQELLQSSSFSPVGTLNDEDCKSSCLS